MCLVAAYLIGAIPFGYLLVKLKSGDDVRTMGSGNIGATNVLRTPAMGLGVATLLLDIAKGALAVWIADRLTHGSLPWMSAGRARRYGRPCVSGVSAVSRRQGGCEFRRRVSYLTPVPLLCTLIVFVAVVAVTRYISMGSIVAAAAFRSRFF